MATVEAAGEAYEAAVGRALAGVEAAHQGHLGAQRQHRAQRPPRRCRPSRRPARRRAPGRGTPRTGRCRTAPCRGAPRGRRWPRPSWRRGASAARARRAPGRRAASVEAPDLAVGEGPVLVADPVGHREVRPQRGEAKRRLGRHGVDDLERARSGSAPTRCMPVSTLTWTSVTDPARAEAGGGGPTPGARVERQGEAVGHDVGHGLGRRLGQDQHRRVDAGVAQLDALLGRRHRQPAWRRLRGRPGPRRRPRVRRRRP